MSMRTISARGSAQQPQLATAGLGRPHLPLGTRNFGGPKLEYKEWDARDLSDDGVCAFVSANANAALSTWTTIYPSFVVPLLACYARALELGIELDISDYQRLACLSPGDECDAVVARLKAAARQAQAVNHHAEPPRPNRHVPDDQMAAHMEEWRVLPPRGRNVSDLMGGMSTNEYNSVLRIFARALELGIPIQVGDPTHIGNRRGGPKLSTLLRFLKAARIDAGTVEWEGEPLARKLAKLALPSTPPTPTSTPSSSNSPPGQDQMDRDQRPDPARVGGQPPSRPPKQSAGKSEAQKQAEKAARAAQKQAEETARALAEQQRKLEQQAQEALRREVAEAARAEITILAKDFSSLPDVVKAAWAKHASRLQSATTMPADLLPQVAAGDVPAVKLAWSKAQAAALKKTQTAFQADMSIDFRARLQSELAREFNGSTKALLRAATGTEEKLQVLVAGRDELARASFWVARQMPDLAFGESMITAPLALPPIPSTQRALVDKILESGKVGDERDEELLRQGLAALHPDILRDLAKAGYKISFGRNNVVNGADALKGARVGGVSLDRAEGVHSQDPKDRRIVVKTWMRDGKVTLDVSTLLHEIGHAYDLVLRQGEQGEGLHADPAFVAAWTAEHKNFSDSYFHEQKEFMAESTGRYLLDPEKFGSEFRLTAKHLAAKLRTPTPAVDVKRLVALYQSMLERAPVTTDVDAHQVLSELEMVNQVRAAGGTPMQAYVIGLDGELPAAEALGREMSHALRQMRRPDIAPGGLNDGFFVVDANTFNNGAALGAKLSDAASGHGGIVLVTGVDSIPASSPGFEVLHDFFDKHRGEVPLVVHGSVEARDAFLKKFPTVLKSQVAISPLTPTQTAELIRRHVANDGYTLSQQAFDVLAAKARGGYQEAMDLWGQIKQAQHQRIAHIPNEVLKAQGQAVGYVLKIDVEGAKLAPKKSAMERLDEFVGLQNVKKRIRQDLAATKVRTNDIAAGLVPQDARALRYFFLGNPGLGKTSVATIVDEVLVEAGASKRRAEFVRGQDLTSAQAVLDLFKRNKGGTIIIDEMHQMALKQETKEAFRALIPLIEQENAEFKDTVFIGMGYTAEMRDMFREVDQGGESRLKPFEVMFEDMGKAELGAVLDHRIGKSGMRVAQDVRDAILDRVLDEQRGALNAGNARDVVSVWNRVLAGRDERMLAFDQAGKTLSAEKRRTILMEDLPRIVREDPDAILAEYGSKYVGADAALGTLQSLVDTVRMNAMLGNDSFESLGPYLSISGPAGTGKTELAGYVARLYCALGFINRPEFTKVSAPDLIARFVGQTAALTRQALRTAFGGTLFIDEVGAIANAVGGFEVEAIKEIVAIINDPKYRRSLGIVVADYPHNVDAFIRMDDGLQRRFDTRVELLVPPANDLFPLLEKTLTDKRLSTALIKDALAANLEELLQAPNFGGAGGMHKFADSIFRAHSSDVSRRLRMGEKLDENAIKTIRPHALQEAMAAERRKIPKSAAADKPAGFEYALETAKEVQEAEDVDEETKVAPLQLDVMRDHQTYLGVIQQREFAELSITDPQAFAAAQKDPQSALAKALGEALNLSPEQALKRAFTVIERVQKYVEEIVKVQVETKKVVKKFDYVCFACGGINGGGGCGYFPVYKNDLPWLIAHSRKPPYDVEVVTREERDEVRTRVVEDVVERNVEG